MSTEFVDGDGTLLSATRHFQESPLGRRINLPDALITGMLWQGVFLWSAIHAASPGLTKPHVRLVNPRFNKIPDGGFWLDPKNLGLSPFASLELINVAPFDTASAIDTSPFGQWINNYPRPRLRQASKAELVTQIQKSTVTLIGDPDLLDPSTDLEWISKLRPGQLIIATTGTPQPLHSLVRWTNAGVRFCEHLLSMHDGSETRILAPAYSFHSFGNVDQAPIPDVERGAWVSTNPHLMLRIDPTATPPTLSVRITPDHCVTENGEVQAISDTAIQTSFDLGPRHDQLPRGARLALSALTGKLKSEIVVRNKPLSLPPLRLATPDHVVIKSTAKILRSRSSTEDVHQVDEDGRNLLIQAVMTSAPVGVISDLLNCGIDPDQADLFGWTAVAYAAALNQMEAAHELVWNGFADLERDVAPGITVGDILDHFEIDVESGDDAWLADDLLQRFDVDVPTIPTLGAVDSASESTPESDTEADSLSDSVPDGSSAPSLNSLPINVRLSPTDFPSIIKSGSTLDATHVTAVARRPLSETLSSIVRRLPDAHGSSSPSASPKQRSSPTQRRTRTAEPLSQISNEELSGEAHSARSSALDEAIDAEIPEPRTPARAFSEVEPIFATVVDVPSTCQPGAIRAAIRTWIARTSPELNEIDPLLPRYDSDRFAVRSDEDPVSGLFALRFDNHVPNGLTFRTEFVVFPTESATIVSTRLQAIRPPGNEDDVEPSVPRIIASFAELGARHRNLPMGKPLPVLSEADAELLAGVIFDSHRVVPLLAVYGSTGHVLEALPPAVRSSLLIVHVAPSAIPAVQRLIGRDFIGFKGAWRIYPAGLKPDSSRYDAPLILDPASIPSSRLANQFRHTIWRLSRNLTDDDCPTYLAARQLILERQKDTQSRLDASQPKIADAAESAPPTTLDVLSESIEVSPVDEPSIAGSPHETTALPRDLSEISELQAQVKGLLASIADLHTRVDQANRQHRADLQSAMEDIKLWKELAEDADAKVNALVEERDRARREAFDLRAQLSYITGGGLASSDNAPSSREYPTSYDALAQWVETHYEGRILMTKKAVKAAMSVRSEPHIVAKVYESLDILANEYIDSRQGDPEARARYMERLSSSQITISHVGEAVNNHRYAAEYVATVGNRRYLCDMHVREFGGTDFHPERQLRIYFAFDESNGRVVIGHLPSHLTSAHS